MATVIKTLHVDPLQPMHHNTADNLDSIMPKNIFKKMNSLSLQSNAFNVKIMSLSCCTIISEFDKYGFFHLIANIFKKNLPNPSDHIEVKPYSAFNPTDRYKFLCKSFVCAWFFLCFCYFVVLYTIYFSIVFFFCISHIFYGYQQKNGLKNKV